MIWPFFDGENPQAESMIQITPGWGWMAPIQSLKQGNAQPIPSLKRAHIGLVTVQKLAPYRLYQQDYH